jgi:hypothetical protein
MDPSPLTRWNHLVRARPRGEIGWRAASARSRCRHVATPLGEARQCLPMGALTEPVRLVGVYACIGRVGHPRPGEPHRSEYGLPKIGTLREFPG